MNLHDLVRQLSGGSDVLDRRAVDHDWPDDLAPRVRAADTRDVSPGALLILSGDLPAPQWPARSSVEAGATVLVLCAEEPGRIPVAPLLEGMTRSGLQALDVLPIAAGEPCTAVIARRTDAPLPLAPYLRPSEHLGVLAGEALVRVLNERAIEGVVWRALDARARRVEKERDASDRARQDAEAALASAEARRRDASDRAQDAEAALASAEARRRDAEAAVGRLHAEVERVRGELAATNRDLTRLLTKPSFRLARLWTRGIR